MSDSRNSASLGSVRSGIRPQISPLTCAPMAARDEIVAYLDELLDSASFEDYGPNGLQVPGAEEVSLVVTGVSAHRELFERARETGAEMVLCHHGMFWNAQPRHVTPQMKERLVALFGSDMSLAAYHLPLDAHPEVGNNALICERLGLERSEPFASHRGRPLGFVGRSAEGVPARDLFGRCREIFGQDPLVFDSGPQLVHGVGIL